MKVKILYFTGTGNSLYIAKYLGNELGKVSLVDMASLYRNKNSHIEANLLGIVFPCYFGTMPDLVKKVVEQLNIKSDYIFSIVSCGTTKGFSLKHLNDLLNTKGQSLSLGISLNYQMNYIMAPYYNLMFKNDIRYTKLLEKNNYP